MHATKGDMIYPTYPAMDTRKNTSTMAPQHRNSEGPAAIGSSAVRGSAPNTVRRRCMSSHCTIGGGPTVYVIVSFFPFSLLPTLNLRRGGEREVIECVQSKWTGRKRLFIDRWYTHTKQLRAGTTVKHAAATTTKREYDRTNCRGTGGLPCRAGDGCSINDHHHHHPHWPPVFSLGSPGCDGWRAGWAE
jgi:hypothetical protein